MRSNFESAQISNKGGREINEDYTLSGSEGGSMCWVVADGLGGHGGGDDASRTACETVMRSFQAEPAVSPDAVMRHIQRADEAVRQMQRARPALSRMRSTVAVVVANATHSVTGHVGDTRVYHLRAGRVWGQTKDHSVPQSLVDAGEISLNGIRHHEDRSRLLRALGEEESARPTVTADPVPIGRGDAFLLCSDGFWENVLETEMELDWAKSRHPFDWLSYMQDRLQERVDGSHDNYTAVAVLGDALPTPPGPLPVAAGAGARQTAVSGAVAPGEYAGHLPKTRLRVAMQLFTYAILPLLLLVATWHVVLKDWKPDIHKLLLRTRKPPVKTPVAKPSTGQQTTIGPTEPGLVEGTAPPQGPSIWPTGMRS